MFSFKLRLLSAALGIIGLVAGFGSLRAWRRVSFAGRIIFPAFLF